MGSASWALRGVMQCLTQDNPVANVVCDKTIFHILPVLNPDGVVSGDYRRNKAGVDLNRCYADPVDPAVAPTILGVRKYLEMLQNRAEKAAAAVMAAAENRSAGSPRPTLASVFPSPQGTDNHSGCISYRPVQLFCDVHGISSDRGVMTY